MKSLLVVIVVGLVIGSVTASLYSERDAKSARAETKFWQDMYFRAERDANMTNCVVVDGETKRYLCVRKVTR